MDLQPSYIVRGVNLGDVDIDGPKRVPLSELSQTLLEGVIKKVEDAYGTTLSQQKYIMMHGISVRTWSKVQSSQKSQDS